MPAVERWALLVVRELLFGPKRYSDLQTLLPRISTNVLAARLEELERAGLVERKTLSPPAASTVYDLTSYGRELEEPIVALGRWGGRRLGAPDGGRAFLPAWGLLALRASFQPDRAQGLDGRYELRIGGEIFHVTIADGDVGFGSGPTERPDAVMSMDARTVPGARHRRGGCRRGAQVEGDPAIVERFVDGFRLPATGPA